MTPICCACHACSLLVQENDKNTKKPPPHTHATNRQGRGGINRGKQKNLTQNRKKKKSRKAENVPCVRVRAWYVHIINMSTVYIYPEFCGFPSSRSSHGVWSVCPGRVRRRRSKKGSGVTSDRRHRRQAQPVQTARADQNSRRRRQRQQQQKTTTTTIRIAAAGPHDTLLPP